MGPKFVLELDTLEMGLLIGLLKGFAPGDPIGIHLAHRMVDLVSARYAEEKRRREALGVAHDGDGDREAG